MQRLRFELHRDLILVRRRDSIIFKHLVRAEIDVGLDPVRRARGLQDSERRRGQEERTLRSEFFKDWSEAFEPTRADIAEGGFEFHPRAEFARRRDARRRRVTIMNLNAD